MTGFVLSRVRAHRLLLAAAFLAVLLTTAVLATLTAYSGAIGDAALRSLAPRPRGQGYTLRITAVPSIHRRLPDLCQAHDSTAAVPAQRKARREYENRVNLHTPLQNSEVSHPPLHDG